MSDVIDHKAVAKRLKAIRKARKVSTQLDMANLIGASENQYNNWERGLPLPAGFAIKIAARTGVTLDYIYRGDISGLPLWLANELDDDDDPFPSITRKRR